MAFTVVVFSSDHGEMGGAHQLSQKSVFYDESAKVPLIVSWPGHTKAGAVDERLTSIGLDLLPTVCDYAGAAAPDDLIGRSVRAIAEGHAVSDWRDHLVCQTVFGVGGSASQVRMVRTASHKYICHDWGQNREQLFDLASDPGERVNLAIEKRHADLLGRHRQLLSEWCVRQRDQFSRHYTPPDCATIPGLRHVPVPPRESTAK